jgi:hypothetical protein
MYMRDMERTKEDTVQAGEFVEGFVGFLEHYT